MTDTYSLLREFADSWALLLLFLFFAAMTLWVFRPGSRRLHDDAARSILRQREPGGCCGSCTCGKREAAR